ncbi:MAG: peptidoglycan-associated lipoprotein Pal [Candidatus Deferrimicrobiaceae bacterium]
MRNRNLILFSLLVLAVAFATGCAKRGMTKSDMDRGDAIEAKIARAEKMGIKKCNPKELADAKAALAHARQEAAEHHEKAESYFAEADKAADNLIALIGPCMEKMVPKPLAMAPTVTLAAEPGTIEIGECATLTWSSTDATGATIDQGIGEVGTSGDRKVCPPDTITYAITATGAGGTTTSSATVNVTQPPPMAEAPMLENIHFDFDQSFIRNNAKPVLGKVAAYMKKNPGAKLQIEGHCDERGTSEYNIALGQRRADSTRKYLTNLGVDGSRISTISYGEEKPADPGNNEKAWAKNRRAAFVIR